MFLPWPIRRIILRIFFKAKIGDGTYVGFSLLNAKRIEIGDGVRVGHFNLVKGLALLKLDNYASIGNFNWISGSPTRASKHFISADRLPALVLGRHAALTQFHRLDCSDLIQFGEFSILAGYGSQLLTHSINIEYSKQMVSPVRVGGYTFIGTRSVLLPGSVLPNYCVLAAGSVLATSYKDEYTLYGGVPAKLIKSLDKGLAYFSRTCGYVK
jgi:acetyltransferase-like isoleucine patch superfamily enzyme